MKLIILSHCKMGGQVFALDVATTDPVTEIITQYHLRLQGNEPLRYTRFGELANSLQKLKPGAVIEVEKLHPADPARISHPEDAVVKLGELKILRDRRPKELRAIAEALAQDSLGTLFPNLHYAGARCYCSGDLANPASMGYLRVQSVEYTRDEYGKLQAQIQGCDGEKFRIPVSGGGKLSTPPEVDDALAAIALSGPMTLKRWAKSKHPKRCFPMLTHVIDL